MGLPFFSGGPTVFSKTAGPIFLEGRPFLKSQESSKFIRGLIRKKPLFDKEIRQRLFLKRTKVFLSSVKALSSALCYKSTYLTVEVVGFEQFLQREVHAVAPVVEGIGRHVDALEAGVGVAQMLIDGHPVLQGKDGEHGG